MVKTRTIKKTGLTEVSRVGQFACIVTSKLITSIVLLPSYRVDFHEARFAAFKGMRSFDFLFCNVFKRR